MTGWWMACGVAAAAVLCVQAQFPNGRRLEGPVPELCAQRVVHETRNGKGYFFSWQDPDTAGQEMDWLGVRNWCRARCMDSVSLQTKEENDYIKQKIFQGKKKYIWTSGRVCDFKGCDREDLEPPRINGWFWTSDLQKIAPSDDRQQTDWGDFGGLKVAQPDNREELQGGSPENCLAVLNNLYGDGVHWHDVACHHVKPWVCEDNELLLQYVSYHNPQLKNLS